MKDKVIDILSVSLFFSLTIFLFGPSSLYFANISEFPFSFLEIYHLFVFVSFLFALPIIAALALLKESAYQKVISLIFILAVLLWLQGNVMVWDYGPLDGREINWNKHLFKGLIECGIWIFSISLAFIKSRHISKIARRASLILIFAQLVSTGVIWLESPEPAFKEYLIDDEPKFKFSFKKNIIILVLDTYRSDIFQEIIDDDNYYKDIFKGFIYFRNSLGGFPTTYPSVSLILTGRYYDNSVPMQQFIKESFLSRASVPMALKESGFRVDLYPDANYEILVDEKVCSNIIKKKYSRADKEAIKNCAAYIYNIAFFRYTPVFFKKFVYNNGTQLFKKMISGKGSGGIGISHKIEDDLRFIAEMDNLSETAYYENCFKFFHLSGMHIPFRFNEELECVELPQDLEGGKRHAKGSLKIVSKFLDILKRIGIYDDSMIFIIGDHGLGYLSVRLTDKLHKDISNSKKILSPLDFKGSALPLVLIKPFGAKAQQMVISDAPVCLGDITKTVAVELGLKGDFAGISLFLAKENIDRKRRYLMYRPELARFFRDYLPSMQEYIVSGHSWFDESWQATGRIFNPPIKKGVVNRLLQIRS